MVDRSILRLLEYDAMPRLRAGLIAAVCAAGLLTAACGSKTKVAVKAPKPAPTVASAPTPVQTAPPASAPNPATPQAPGPVAAPPASRAAAGQPNAAKEQKAEAAAFQEQRPEPAPVDEVLTPSTLQTAMPTPETTEAVVEDLAENSPDIEIPLNPKVLSYVDLFSGRLKGYLEDGLNRGAQYLPMIQEVFRAEGLPLDLAYVPLIESAFKPNAVSRAKARGMWQFMRGTALENGLQHDWYIDERADPEKATRAAAKYLKTLYGTFGDWHLALASYNGGPGRVQRAMTRSGKDDFWELTTTTRYLPRETRDYVPLILAAVIIARNPAQYGMTVVEPEPLPTPERVVVSTAVDLRHVADWVGVPVQTIQDMNPELRRWTTPVKATSYALRVPEGGADVVRARLVEMSPAELAPLNHYSVKKGETLQSVARKLGVTRADLAEANYIGTSARLNAGQSLIVPRAPSLLQAKESGASTVIVQDEAGAADVRPVADSGRTIKATERAPTSSGSSNRNASVRVVHKVKSGETLTSIARTYRTTVASLKEWNKLRGNTIQTGQRLSVMVKRTVATD
jgi:membrane-bound lytic murein transglycosylase D